MTANLKLVEVLTPKSGRSQKGNDWVAQEFIAETIEQYPKKICFQLFGEERVKSLEDMHIGDEIAVDFDIESREYNGKWFTQCNAWRLTHANAQKQAPQHKGTQGDETQTDMPF